MKDRILSSEIIFYSYFKFLDDLLSELVTDLLGAACFEGLIETRARARTFTKTSTKEIEMNSYKKGDKADYLTLHVGNYNSKNAAFKPEEHVFSETVEPYTYFVLSAEDSVPQNLHGDFEEDNYVGIPHVHFAADRGLLRNAKLAKTNQEFLPEARFASEGDFYLNQLSNVYDANFNMLGNTLFTVGQHIYFNTRSIGVGDPFHYKKQGENIQRSWANIMGLGGYHLVTEVHSSITPGKYTTDVKARWVSGGSMPASSSMPDDGD